MSLPVILISFSPRSAFICLFPSHFFRRKWHKNYMKNSCKQSRANLPSNFPYHHHKKKCSVKKDEGEMKKAKYNKKIFLLISFNFFPLLWLYCALSPRTFERMSKAGFLLTPTRNDTFPRIHGTTRQKTKRRLRENIKPLYSHLNRITSLIVYLAMCVTPQSLLCVWTQGRSDESFMTKIVKISKLTITFACSFLLATYLAWNLNETERQSRSQNASNDCEKHFFITFSWRLLSGFLLPPLLDKILKKLLCSLH